MKCFHWILLLAAASVFSLAGERAAAMGHAWLISPDEAKKLHHDEEEWREFASVTGGKSKTDGPRVVVHQPPSRNGVLHVAHEDVGILVEFKENIDPVDMSSLKIVGKKYFVTKDITDRLAKYISGTKIDVPTVKIPKGRFRIEIFIKDVKGRESIVGYLLEIA